MIFLTITISSYNLIHLNIFCITNLRWKDFGVGILKVSALANSGTLGHIHVHIARSQNLFSKKSTSISLWAG